MKLHYRPEIDGLRALAVLSVIFYHAELELGNKQLFSGGFFGVDVFFVISGFLITSILILEYKKTNTFSILNFYGRRVRRLLPALFAVVIVSMPFAWNLLLPQQLVDFSESILNSLFFTSNFYWSHALQQYDAESALLQPFLHTWSLAVEEQFYIFYPILLMAVYSWNRNKITLIFTVLAFLSLLFSQFMTAENASFSFYMLPSRLWELLCGGIASFIHFNRPKIMLGGLAKMMPTFGFLLIIYAVVFIDFSAIHPGYITLIPVLGTVIIILFANQGDFVTKMLTSKPMVGIGLISYSLYLWHYPIFAFGRHLVGIPTWFDKITWVVLAGALSVATYFYIEKPFRKKEVSYKKLLILLSITGLVITSINIIWIKNNGFGERLGFINSLVQQSKQIWVTKDGQKCHSGGRGRKPNFPLEESCEFKFASGNKSIILVGDSHAATLSEDLRKLANLNAYNFIQLTEAGCPHIKGFKKRMCLQRSNNLAKYLKNYPNSTVIYSARIPLFLEGIRFVGDGGEKEAGYKHISKEEINSTFSAKARALVDTLDTIKKINTKLVIVYPFPEQGFHLKDKLFRELRFSNNKENLPTITTSYQHFKDRVFRSNQVLDSVLGTNVYRVFPEKLFCQIESGKCIVSEKEKLYFEKDNHVSPLGSGLIVAEIARELNLQVAEK